MKPYAIILDIDGTLANAKHRLHHIEKDPKDWKKFFSEAIHDRINPWCRAISERFCGPYYVILLTGRGEEDREMTERWLLSNGVLFDDLCMRAYGDRRQDTVVKREIYEQTIAQNYDVLFAVEDRGSVVRMWRELGITCLQCSDWEEKADPGMNKEVQAHFNKGSDK